MKSQIDRFNEKWEPVTESGCWIWTAYTNACGYGSFRHNGKMKLAHRVSYELHIAPIPSGMVICHTCDTPACVNPNHLFPGTQLENIEDRHKKGRTSSGEGRPSAKLTWADVLEIRRRYDAGGVKQGELADEYGVCPQQISAIIRRMRWR